ncbi:MAG: hypothetical protein QM820_35320 [Minicystis sp.]
MLTRLTITCRSRTASPRSAAGTSPATETTSSNPLGVGPLGEQLADLLDDAPHVEVGRRQLELAGLGAAPVEHGVEQIGEAVAQPAQPLAVVALLGGELGVEQEAGDPGDAGDQRPQLVAQVGEALALRALRGQRGAERGYLGVGIAIAHRPALVIARTGGPA